MQDELLKSAYHEAGHAVMAKKCGFSVSGISINGSHAGAVIDYGPFLAFSPYLFHYNTYIEHDENFRLSNASAAIPFIELILFVLFAGQIAEKHFIDPTANEMRLGDTGMPYDDMQRINNIINFSKDHLIKLAQGDFDGYARAVHACIIYEPTWKVIEKVANELISSPTLALEQERLNEILNTAL